MTYRANYLGSDETVYSFDAAKAWVSRQAGRTLTWVEAPDGKCWHGYKNRGAADESDPNAPFGFMAHILTESHPDF